MSFKAKEPRRSNPEMLQALEDVSKEATTRLNVEIPESSMKLLKKVVAEKEVTIKEYVNGLLEESLERDAEEMNIG